MASSSAGRYWVSSNAARFESRSFTNGRVHAVDRVAALFKERMSQPQLPASLVGLDLAGGTGLFVRRLQELPGGMAFRQKLHLTCVDISSQHLERAKEVFDEVVEADILKLEQLDFADNSEAAVRTGPVDFVVHNNCIEDYVRADKQRFLDTVASMLKSEGGVFFLQCYSPNDEPMGSRLGETSIAFAAAGNKLYLEDMDTLVAMCEKAGLVVEHQETFAGHGDYDVGRLSREFLIIVASRKADRPPAAL
jgi:SAM-dependent methyltransferase